MANTDKKALTVTYGSFSVILEGQENPFDMLRQVTEYFREIAEINPSFGAIPTKNKVSTAPRNDQPDNNQGIDTKLDLPETVSNSIGDHHQGIAQKPSTTPLVLHTPVATNNTAFQQQMHPETQALANSTSIAQPQREFTQIPPKTARARYPFRHFPARRPNG